MNVSLHVGCGLAGLRTLADNSVDLALLDPPWDERAHAGFRARSGGRLKFPPFTPELIEEFAEQLARVTDGWILIMVPERGIEIWATALERGGATFQRLGIATKTNPHPFPAHKPSAAAEFLVLAWAGDTPMRWNGLYRAAQWLARPARWDTNGKARHPNQKPVPLLRQLIEDFSPLGGIVCDPTAGSGSTGVAAVQARRRFIGWELDAEYHRVGVERLARQREAMAASEQTELFSSGPRAHSKHQTRKEK